MVYIQDSLSNTVQNASSTYGSMLLAQAFTKLLRLFDEGRLKLCEDFVQDQLLVVLVQIVARTLYSQGSDGAWEAQCEHTAYAVITLETLRTVSWLDNLDSYIVAAIGKGRMYLERNHEYWNRPCFTWIEKVTYGSPLISQTYCLAAMQISTTPIRWSIKSRKFWPSKEKASALIHFFASLPMFKSQPNPWILEASFIESTFFLGRLRRHRLDIFPRKDMAKDSYLDFIPFTWTACAAMETKKRVGNFVLQDMMTLSMLNYQVDEYMETIISRYFGLNLEPARAMLSRLCYSHEIQPRSSNMENSHVPKVALQNGSLNGGLPPEEEAVLRGFISYVLGHSKVVSSPPSIQAELRKELTTFLTSHIDQIEDSQRLAEQAENDSSWKRFSSPKSSYYKWVRTTSANHTSCPFSFIFFTCLISSPNEDFFASVKQKYFAQDVCQHLATMCRQYNDYGSSARDIAEQNLNSLNFPEFHAQNDNEMQQISNGGSALDRALIAKDDLTKLAGYERDCLELALKHLRDVSKRRDLHALDLFIRVTDLYGQIYVARDIASRMK